MTVLVFPDGETYEAVVRAHPTLAGADYTHPTYEAAPGKRVLVTHPWEKYGQLDEVKAELADHPEVLFLDVLPADWDG